MDRDMLTLTCVAIALMVVIAITGRSTGYQKGLDDCPEKPECYEMVQCHSNHDCASEQCEHHTGWCIP